MAQSTSSSWKSCDNLNDYTSDDEVIYGNWYIKCKRCAAWKNKEDFYKMSASRSGKQVYCKTCSYKNKVEAVRRRKRIKKYNFDLSTCQMCGKSSSDTKICIDHDHETGKIRSILCNRCNMAFGAIGDSIKKGVEWLCKMEYIISQNQEMMEEKDKIL